MLNTSLHNPNVRDKPGVDRFISMNRGINEGGDLPEELLRVCDLFYLFLADNYMTAVRSNFFFFQNLYESIKNEPFKIPEDDGNDLTHTFFNPDREGWLLKLGKIHAVLLLGSKQLLALNSISVDALIGRTALCCECSLGLCCDGSALLYLTLAS